MNDKILGKPKENKKETEKYEHNKGKNVKIAPTALNVKNPTKLNESKHEKNTKQNQKRPKNPKKHNCCKIQTCQNCQET